MRRASIEAVKVHLVDGTYELFRAWFGAPAARGPSGREVGATRGLLASLSAFLRDESVTHVAVAFDHVIESFRNGLFEGYKSSAGVPSELLDQFELAERAARALGMVVWPMVEFEADDAMATGARLYAELPGVEQLVVVSPDKDLCQCVRGDRVVVYDRKRRRFIDELGVVAKFGVPPSAIADYLALVGDAADGIPGIPGWGPRTAATLLARYGTIEAIPGDPRLWDVPVRGAPTLARALAERRDDARLYVKLATLRTDVPLTETLDDLAWQGARRAELLALCAEIGEGSLLERVVRWRD